MTADVLGRRPEHPIGEAATLRRFAFPGRRERKLGTQYRPHISQFRVLADPEAEFPTGVAGGHLAWQEALTEVFSAIYIAERAGCVVSQWSGAPVTFRPDIHAVHSLVCSANPRLHAEVLRTLRGIRPPKGLAP